MVDFIYTKEWPTTTYIYPKMKTLNATNSTKATLHDGAYHPLFFFLLDVIKLIYIKIYNNSQL